MNMTTKELANKGFHFYDYDTDSKMDMWYEPVMDIMVWVKNDKCVAVD